MDLEMDLDLEMKMNLCCRTSGWSCKENDESIYPASSLTRNNDLFEYDTHLQVYIQCRIGHFCTMYHGTSSPSWLHIFFNESIA